MITLTPPSVIVSFQVKSWDAVSKKMTPPATEAIVKMTPPATGATETQFFYLSPSADFKGPIYKEDWTKVPCKPACKTEGRLWFMAFYQSLERQTQMLRLFFPILDKENTKWEKEALQMGIQVRGKRPRDRCPVSPPEAGERNNGANTHCFRNGSACIGMLCVCTLTYTFMRFLICALECT